MERPTMGIWLIVILLDEHSSQRSHLYLEGEIFFTTRIFEATQNMSGSFAGNTIKYLRVPDEVIDKVQEETKSGADRRPPGVGRGRGRGREDGAGRQTKGIGRGVDDGNKGPGPGRGRGGPPGKSTSKGGGRGRG